MATFSFCVNVGDDGDGVPECVVPASLPRPELVRQESIASGCDSCWICLSTEGEMEYSCRCPCSVHSICRAKWQLMKAGTREETHCRFCNQELVLWQDVLLESKVCLEDVEPVIKVRSGEGKFYYVEADPGQDGMEKFHKTVKLLCNFDEREKIELAFGCLIPDPHGPGSSNINISGLQAYEVLLHLAKRKAAKGNKLLTISLESLQPGNVYNANVPEGTYIPHTRDSIYNTNGAGPSETKQDQVPCSGTFPRKRFSMKAVLSAVSKAVSS